MNPAAGASGRAVGPKPALAVAVILLVSLALSLPGLHSLPLCDPQESRCAMTVAEMLKNGHSLVPRLGGRAYLEKPPLFFWLAAAGTALTGDVELGGRAVAAVSAAGLCLCVWFLGLRMFSARAGLLGGLALAASVEHLALGRWYRMDMPFTLFVAMSLLCFWLAEESRGELASASKQVRPAPRPAGRPGARAWYGFYLFAALATMTKGPLGLILPVSVVVGYLLAGRQWRRIRELVHPGGLMLFGIVALPWFVYMTCSYWPDYHREFFFHSHLQRAAVPEKGSAMPPGFYLAVLAAGLVPWSLLLPAAAIRSFRDPPRRRANHEDAPRTAQATRPHLFLWTWALLVWIFFELSRTKFVHYVLPAFGPLALLVGQYLSSAIAAGRRAVRQRSFRWAARVAFFGAGALPLAITCVEIATRGSTDNWMLVLWLSGAAAMMLIRQSILSARPGVLAATLTASMIITSVFVCLHSLPRIYADRSLRKEGLAAAGKIPPGDRVFILGGKRYSFFLYAGRPEARRYAFEQIDALATELQQSPATVFYKGKTKLHFLRLRSRDVKFGPVMPVGRDYNIIRAVPVKPSRQ